MPYSERFKGRMVQRMAQPGGMSASELAVEEGVAQPTLSRWLREARRLGSMTTDPSPQSNGRKEPPAPAAQGGKSPRAWTAQEKFRVLLEAARIPEAERGAFLRREGLHEAQIQEWSAAATLALNTPSKRRYNKRSPEAKRIRELERELRRKDKALAEVAALLTLKKKVLEIWGDGEDDTGGRSEK